MCVSVCQGPRTYPSRCRSRLSINICWMNEWMSLLWLEYFIVFYYIFIKIHILDQGFAGFLSLHFISLLAYITTKLWRPVKWLICHAPSYIRTFSHVVSSTWNTLPSIPSFYQSPVLLFAKFLTFKYLSKGYFSKGSSLIIISKHLHAPHMQTHLSFSPS